MIFIWKIPIHWNNCFSFPKKLKLWIFFLFTAIFQKRKIFLILRKRHNLNQLHDCPHYTLRQSPQRQPHTQAISFFPGCWAQLLPVVRLDFWQTCISLQRGCVAGVFFFASGINGAQYVIWNKSSAPPNITQVIAVCCSQGDNQHTSVRNSQSSLLWLDLANMIFLANMPWPALQKKAKEAETGKETTNISKRGKKYCLKKNAIFAPGVIFILLPPSAVSDSSYGGAIPPFSHVWSSRWQPAQNTCLLLCHDCRFGCVSLLCQNQARPFPWPLFRLDGVWTSTIVFFFCMARRTIAGIIELPASQRKIICILAAFVQNMTLCSHLLFQCRKAKHQKQADTD